MPPSTAETSNPARPRNSGVGGSAIVIATESLDDEIMAILVDCRVCEPEYDFQVRCHRAWHTQKSGSRPKRLMLSLAFSSSGDAYETWSGSADDSCGRVTARVWRLAAAGCRVSMLLSVA